jgi:septin family protein
MAVPVVRPRKVPKYTCEQSHYDSVPQIPFRMLALGPSKSGKSRLIQALLCDFLKSHKDGSSCFHKIAVLSPSVNVDAVWGP